MLILIIIATLAVLLVVVGVLGLLASYMFVYKKLNTAQLSLNPFTGGTTEHHQGLSLKHPWASLQEPEVDMTAEIVVTSGGIFVMSMKDFMAGKMYEKIGTRAYETKDSVLYGSWATAIKPKKGVISNFIKETPGTGALMVMAEIDITISDDLAKKPTEDVLKDKRSVGEKIAKVFDGKDELENDYGIIVSKPKLFDLDLGQRSKDAAEKLFETVKFGEAVKEMKLQHPDWDADKLASAVLVATGVTKKNIFEVEGLEGTLKGLAEAFFNKDK